MIFKISKELVILGIIILLASVLRLWRLGSFPALNADEAAIGYNAYSLIETGKDEHGNSWPIHFQSFNDFKPGLYFYLVIPFIKFFGMNELSVRLPNALLGISTIPVLYLLIKEFEKIKGQSIINPGIKYLASFLLAISPWHIHYSRGGWEVNTSTFLIVLGLFIFLKFITNRKILTLILSVICFELSMYAYHAARVVTPLLFVGLLFLYKNEFKTEIRKIIITGVIGILILAPLAIDITRNGVVSRASGVGILADTGPIERTNEQRSEHTGVTAQLMHNKVVNYGLAFLKNWGEHYHGLFLFISGDTIERNKVPETGQMYMFEIITVLIGLYFLITNYSLDSKFYGLLVWWLLIGPIPAALTFQSPHALRSQNMVIPLTVISALGISKIISIVEKYMTGKVFRNITFMLLSLFVFWNFTRYLHMYWKHMSKEYVYSSQYGVKELANYLMEEKKTYKNIIVSSKYDQPYILLLFYLNYPPSKFQNDHTLTPRDRYGFSTVDKFSNYTFKSIDWDRDKLFYRDSLIIGSNEEIPDEANITKRIYGTNDHLYFKVVTN